MESARKKALMAALLTTAVTLPSVSQAGLITETISYDDSEITGDLTFDFSNLDQLSAGDVTIDFQARGDLGDSYSRRYRSGYCHGSRNSYHCHSGYYYNSYQDNGSGTYNSNTSHENIAIGIEAIDLGQWLDGVDNDLISGSDTGYFDFLHSGSYTMAAETFNSLIDDSLFSVVFDYSDSVNHGYSNEYASVSISYDAVVNSAASKSSVNVPEPSSLAIFALGVIGLASRRKFSK